MTRKESIRQKAAELFRKKGFQATSMREIADGEGIKAASIYNHFASKQELLADMLLFIANAFTSHLEKVTSQDIPAADKLRQLITFHIQMTADHTDEIALIAGEWIHLIDPERSSYLHMRNNYERSLVEIIDQGKAEGSFKNIETDILLYSTLSPLRWLYTWYSKNKECDVEMLKRQLTETILKGYTTD